MAPLNVVQLVDRLGRAPELVLTSSSGAVATFTLATVPRSRLKDQTRVRTNWHNIKVLRARARTCAQHLDRRRLVMVVGALQTDRCEKDGRPRSRGRVLARACCSSIPPDKTDPSGDALGQADGASV